MWRVPADALFLKPQAGKSISLPCLQELEELLDDDEDMADMYLERKREARLAAAISDNEGSGDEDDNEGGSNDRFDADVLQGISPTESTGRRRSLAEPASPWASVADRQQQGVLSSFDRKTRAGLSVPMLLEARWEACPCM